MKIIGIDPGSHRAGYSVLEKPHSNKYKLLTYGTINIPPKTKSPDNLIIIKNELISVIKEYQPECASIEEMFFYDNLKTVSRVFEARGVILLTLGEFGIKIIQPTVTQIKKGTTGSGKADKKQIQNALKLILGIDELKGYDDAWDAIAAAFVGFAMVS